MSEEASLQEIFEQVEARGKALKKILSHLSKIEEEDEGDKANYRQSKLNQEDID